jgi:hypothetical protein
MPEKLYIVELAGEDPLTRIGIQPVHASRCEEDGDYFCFLDSRGNVAALFHRSAVRTWRESSESELEELERRIDAKS